MTKTWYELNKKNVENLILSMKHMRMSNQLEGLYDIKPAEQCIIMLIGDGVRWKGRIEELEKELELLRKGQNTD